MATCAHAPGWVSGKAVREEEEEVVQLYVQDPVLARATSKVRVKTDIRIYGSVVSFDPLRLYISKHGYYRSGSPSTPYSLDERGIKVKLAHVTHHIPKIDRGDFVTPSGPGFASCGTLERWYAIAEANGLDRAQVWRNIKSVLGAYFLAARPKMGCTNTPAACDTTGVHFTADMIVDSRGKVFMIEAHVTLGVKAFGFGDPEAGWVAEMSEATRQGTVGTATMFLARHAHPERPAVEAAIAVVPEANWSALHWGNRPRQLLVDILTELRVACLLGVEPVFPGAGEQEMEIPADLAAAYAVVHQFEELLPPADCSFPVDFNAGRPWNNVWEVPLATPLEQRERTAVNMSHMTVGRVLPWLRSKTGARS